MKKHVINEYSPELHPAYVSNGLIGFRLGKIPFLNAQVQANGYFAVSPEKRTEEYGDAPFPIGADIHIGWYERLSERPDKTVFHEQSFDFSNGELDTRFDFVAAGVTVKVHVLTFVSRTIPALALQEINIEVDKPCDLRVKAILDCTGIPGKEAFRAMLKTKADGAVLWESNGGLCKIGAALMAEFEGPDLKSIEKSDLGYEGSSPAKVFMIDAKPEHHYRIRQMGSLVPDVMHTEPHWQAARMVEAGLWRGWENVREDNRKAWAELWKGRIKLIGADESWQDLTDAAFFYLHSSAHPSMPCSISPFGLSRRHAFYGHVFWDTDVFMFPPLLLTAPDSARAILDYRWERMNAARRNAALHGYRGLMFPWESGLSGGEVTPMSSTGWDEQHVSQDVAIACAQYANATGDDLFLHDQAWPVMKGVAEWIASRVTKTNRGYEILHVTGIDEGIAKIDNNSFINIISKIALRQVMETAKQLGKTPPASWGEIERNLFIPIDAQNGHILKNDSYVYNGGLCCPEVLVAYFPFGYSHTPEVDAATYRYYLDLAHTFIGGAMLSPLCAVWAARNGDRKLSRQMLDSGIGSQLLKPFMIFTEHVGGNDSVFLTNLSGYLMGLLYGLTGLSLDSPNPNEWCKHPVVMPEGWDGLEVDRIYVHSNPARLTAKHGDAKAKIEF